MQNIPAMDVAVDEVWGFVGCKEETRQRKKYSEEHGDVCLHLHCHRKDQQANLGLPRRPANLN
jgi:hypothetical protein